MGMFNKYKLIAYHIDGLPYRNNCPLRVMFDDNFQNVIFKEFMGKSSDVILPVSKITKAGAVKVEEIERGNVIGRAIAGGLIFGGAGAVVGAMSAQERTKIKYLYCFNYVSMDEEKSIVIRFDDVSEFKFRRKLSELLPNGEYKKGESSAPIIL